MLNPMPLMTLDSCSTCSSKVCLVLSRLPLPIAWRICKYQRRLAAGDFEHDHYQTAEVENPRKAALAVAIFLLATLGIVLFGSIEAIRPKFITEAGTVTMEMSHIIEVLMLTAAALILLCTKTDGIRAAQGSINNEWMHIPAPNP